MDTSYTGGNNEIIEKTGHEGPMGEWGVPEDVDYFVFATWNSGSGRYRKVHKFNLDLLLVVQPDSTFPRQILPIKGTIMMIGQLRTRKL